MHVGVHSNSFLSFTFVSNFGVNRISDLQTATPLDVVTIIAEFLFDALGLSINVNTITEPISRLPTNFSAVNFQ